MTALGALALPLHGALACTSFVLRSQDGGIVYARTMEFALPLHSRVIVVPRNLALTGTGPDGQAGSGLAQQVWGGRDGRDLAADRRRWDERGRTCRRCALSAGIRRVPNGSVRAGT